MSNQKFEPTAEELKKFEQSFKDPEFKKLFFEYMDEISDPKNKELYERELEQLEREKGNKVRYVKPDPEFCVKTDNGKDKVYINICSSNEIQQANAKKTHGGTNWSIPYSLANGREDHVKGKTVMIYDCVFHPMTIRMSSNAQFKIQIISTAIEGINRQFNVKLDPEYKLLKKTNQGLPQMTMIREKDESLEPTKETSLDFIETLVEQEKREPVKPKTKVPAFKIVHQNKYSDYQKFTNERERQYGARPDALSIRIQVPLLKSLSGVELDINQKSLDLVVPDLYQLHLDLPFPVLEEEGEAKFEKANGLLIVNVPVMTEFATAAEQPGFTELYKDDANEEKESNAQVGENVASDIESLTDNLQAAAIVGSKKDNEAETLEMGPIHNVPAIEEIKEKGSKLQDVAPTIPKPPRFYCHQSLETITFIISVPEVQDLAVECSPTTLKALIQSPYETRYLDLVFPYEFTLYSKNVNSENVCIVLQKKVQELWVDFKVKDGDYQKLTFRTFENVSNVIHVPKNDVVITAKRNHEKVIVNIEKKPKVPAADVSVTPAKANAEDPLASETPIVYATRDIESKPPVEPSHQLAEQLDSLKLEEHEIKFVNNLLFELD
ncbi:Protein kintoun [Terramyces sp. JEL0728]|nr:Protein kintoun [Terramyces sp. JEL0728]